MTFSKTIIALVSLASFSQLSVAEPGGIQSNVTPDILVGGLNIETGNHTGPILNGSSTVHAKNARSYNSGLCTFKVNFSIYNDSNVKPGQFVTTMSYNEHPNVINDYTVLNAAGIKTYEWLVQLKPGNNTIKVHADQQNNIQESNEINNRLSKRVHVIGKCETSTTQITPNPSIKMDTGPQKAQKGCEYNPNSAVLPCSSQKRKKMKLIDPFK